MARKPQPGWWIYKEQMDPLCYGDALWEPAPTHNYTRISIGDVGFIRRGQFHLLFSAGCPLGDRQLGDDVPDTFEELSIGTPVFGQPRLPVCLRTDTVREVGAGLGATVPTTLPLEPGAHFSFELTGNRGAALVTKYPTYRGDSLRESAFEKYTKRHYESWVAFARTKEYGNDVHPVLVSGFDMTRDFAMVAYSNESTSLESDLTIAVPMLASASASVWGTWRTRCSPHTNFGPQQCSLPLSDRVIGFPSSQSLEPGSIPNEFNQCVFVRYYTMRSRKWMPPKVIRAGAGPHDLGSGDNRGGTFPELTVLSNAEHMSSGDEGLGGQSNLTADDTDSEPDIVVRNTPQDGEYDSWGAISDYVFQSNSDAISVLMHHRDLVEIRLAGDADGISALLAKHRPRIVVDSNGVARITCQGIKQPGPLPLVTPPKRNWDGIDDWTSFTAGLDELCVDKNSDDLSNSLRAAFDERGQWEAYLGSLEVDIEKARRTLEVFDKVIQATPYDATTFEQFRRLCDRMGLLPTSHVIPEGSIQTTEHLVASYDFGGVWEGIYKDERVALKALRTHKGDDAQEVRKALYNEVVVWKQISHPNLVPFLGISEAPTPICMVSKWMPNGNVRDYVWKNPETSRLQLMLDISCGLSFLHTRGIVHGALRGNNILVDESGCAQLTDYGLTNIVSLNRMVTSDFKGPYRWMAPEVFDTNNEGWLNIPTRESDVFALGMVTFEVFTGRVPFPEDRGSAMVVERIVNGERPSRPPMGEILGLSDDLWEIVQSSLVSEVEERPLASTFVDFLEKATPDITVLKQLTKFDANSKEHVQSLRHIFGYGDNTLLGMRKEETLVVAEVLDRVLNSSYSPTLRGRCLHGLQKVSARCGILPKSYCISYGSLSGSNGSSPTTGRISSTCQWLMDGKLVAVKTINSDRVENFNAFKHRLCIDGVMWKRLRHPNVVSFLGFIGSGSPSPPFALVYSWVSNGDLSEYLHEYPNADKLSLSSDVANGLTYLHSHDLVHGNLTVHKILMGSDGVARISDYGLEIDLCDMASSESVLDDVRWMAPEVLGTKNKRVPPGDRGKSADIYSFAMVMFEISTGTAPFPNESDNEIVDRVMTGFRPERRSESPSQGMDELWEQIEACWNQRPNERPTAPKVQQTLLALREAQHHNPVVSVEDPGGEVTMSHSIKSSPSGHAKAVSSAADEILRWTSKDPRESQLFSSRGVIYRFQTDTGNGGRTVTSLWRTICPNKEVRVARIEWAANGGILGRVAIGKRVVPMADLVRQDPRAYGWRTFDGPDGHEYRWGPSPSNSGDVILKDPNGHIIARLQIVMPTKYEIGDVYHELHYIRSAGAGTVMHPPLMDTVTATAMLYRFVTAFGL